MQDELFLKFGAPICECTWSPFCTSFALMCSVQ